MNRKCSSVEVIKDYEIKSGKFVLNHFILLFAKTFKTIETNTHLNAISERTF